MDEEKRKTERRTTERRTGGVPGGLRVSEEDLQWLRLYGVNPEAVPSFNRSRLIALGFLANSEGKMELTERGRKALE
jgi:hypothetical protein